MNADDYLEHMYSQGYYDNSRELQSTKKCIECEHFDQFLVLTSNPPKYICQLHKGKYLTERERFTYSCDDFKKMDKSEEI